MPQYTDSYQVRIILRLVAAATNPKHLSFIYNKIKYIIYPSYPKPYCVTFC